MTKDTKNIKELSEKDLEAVQGGLHSSVKPNTGIIGKKKNLGVASTAGGDPDGVASTAGSNPDGVASTAGGNPDGVASSASGNPEG